jgi:RNA polymerase sigma factor (sigma-70 family)
MEAAHESDGLARRDVPPPVVKPEQAVVWLMIAWQETGSHDALESLVRTVLPELERVIAGTLAERGIRDPAAVDEAWSLVLDHLRRLAGAESEDRRLTRFTPARVSSAAEDPGWGYLRQLARSRARDVARRRRRGRSVAFSQLGADDEQQLAETPLDEAPAGEATRPAGDRIRQAADSLEPRLRLLVELLLDGKSQAVIAHVLGRSEGTVSRLRRRAIAALRQILGD